MSFESESFFKGSKKPADMAHVKNEVLNRFEHQASAKQKPASPLSLPQLSILDVALAGATPLVPINPIQVHELRNVASSIARGAIDEATHHPVKLLEQFAIGTAIGIGTAAAIVALPEVAVVAGGCALVGLAAAAAGVELAKHGSEWGHDIHIMATPENFSSSEQQHAQAKMHSFGAGVADLAASSLGAGLTAPAGVIAARFLSTMVETAPEVVSTATAIATEIGGSQAGTSLVPWVQNFDKPILASEELAQTFSATLGATLKKWTAESVQDMPAVKAINRQMSATFSTFKKTLKDAGVTVTSDLIEAFTSGSADALASEYAGPPALTPALNDLQKEFARQSATRTRALWELEQNTITRKLDDLQSILTTYTREHSLPEIELTLIHDADVADDADDCLGAYFGGDLSVAKEFVERPAASQEMVATVAHELTHAEQDALIFRFLAQKMGVKSNSSQDQLKGLATEYAQLVTKMTRPKQVARFTTFSRQTLKAVHDQPLTPMEKYRAVESLNGFMNYTDMGPEYRANFLEREAYHAQDVVESNFQQLSMSH